ncbi:MAG TPA: gfo/Idh/MocA family oxidoreductase, partial [Methylococcales bacterium]
MKKLKCAVIGTGYLGKFHAEKYASLPDCELFAVVDIDEAAA